MQHPYLFEASFVGGQKLTGVSDYIFVEDPYTRDVLGMVPSLKEEDVRNAIFSAEQAFEEWSKTAPSTRAQFLNRFAEHLLANKEDLGTLISLESGKPFREGIAEVQYAASFFQWFSQEAERIYGRSLSSAHSSLDIHISKEPIGVCAFITPWNFPLAMLAKKIAPALAAGCTIIAKPAEQTPFSGIALGKIANDIGLPKGVINIITGDAQLIGEIFCSTPQIQKLSFTGSTEVGRLLLQQSAPQIKKTSLELGGNAPFIIFNDADIKKTIPALLASKFRNGGQTCIASNRFLVQKDILPKLLAQLNPILTEMKFGDPFHAKNEIGTMIDQSAVQKIHRLLKDSLEKGAEIILGELPSMESNIVAPILLKGLSPEMEMWKEEIFGPVIAIKEFETEEEAISLANDTIHGLASYIMTEDQNRIRRLSRAIQTGLIGFNTGKISMAMTPFGGFKQSGLGREGGLEGIEEYLEVKSVFQMF